MIEEESVSVMSNTGKSNGNELDAGEEHRRSETEDVLGGESGKEQHRRRVASC
jgi:hypothetical protein